MKEVSGSQTMEKIFTRDSHHENITVILVAQNHFASNQSIIRNCTYKVIFKDPLDDLVVRTISSQLMYRSKNGQSFLNWCFEALSTYFPNWSHPYLIIDGNSKNPSHWSRIRTKIFPENDESFPLCLLKNPQC